ncbi:sulfite exporter TauE/SafE family protein [Nioella nitratireducens]|uniref:sulfite exporter TauE/SafE family protein n=1 Tax=Nioella nitratireducens TaxID=1287720 RepID=UPI0008FD0A00|nr:sulfite exporter TauE/SafE family protein [Nioella nitratireducens]
MGAVLETLPITILAAAIAVTMFGGFVKGAVGFALPLIMMSGLAAILPPEVALAGLIIPAMVANMWQAFRQGLGGAVESVKRHWPFIGIVLVCMAISAQLVLSLPQWLFFTVIGVPISLYSALQLLGWQLRVPTERRRLAVWLFGGLAGVFGGFSAIFGPPTVAYLISLDTEKSEQVRVQGMVYFLGNVLLFGSHLRSGVLNADTIPFSLMMVVPAMLGMWIGFQVQDRMDRATFLKATLVVLLLAGLNLVRRGVM